MIRSAWQWLRWLFGSVYNPLDNRVVESAAWPWPKAPVGISVQRWIEAPMQVFIVVNDPPFAKQAFGVTSENARDLALRLNYAARDADELAPLDGHDETH